MKSFKAIISFSGLMVLSGCASIVGSSSVEVHPKPGKQMYMCGGGLDHYKNGISKDAIESAKEAFLYAMMASNSYSFDMPRYFNIPSWEFIETRSSWTGFSAEVYKKIDSEKYAIVFRGTDNLSDWIFGNLLGFQYIEADWYSKYIGEKYSNAEEIVLIGHSLGAAMALYTSRFDPTEKVKKTFLFSYPSAVTRLISEPLAWFFNFGKLFNPMSKSGRFGITEDNDILDFNRGDTQEFDFQDSDGIKEHSMYRLSRGLLMVSAANDNSDAIKVLVNIGCFKNSANDVSEYHTNN